MSPALRLAAEASAFLVFLTGGPTRFYVKVSGTWRYVYRAIDEHGQTIDVFVESEGRATLRHF